MGNNFETKYCLDCNKEKSSAKSIRCWDCFVAFNRGNNCWQYNGGKPKCIDCGTLTTQYTSKRCLSCYRKLMIGETSPRYKGLTFERSCLECKVNFISRRMATFCSKECLSKNKRKPLGEKAWNWVSDRSKLQTDNSRNDSLYREWRLQVWKRDKFTCRIADNKCNGKIEAHHILGWSDYPELRYKINNGITLCHAHHPKKRAEEKRLVHTFTELVSMSVSK